MEDPWKSVEFRRHYEWFLTIPSSNLRHKLVSHGLITFRDSMNLRSVKSDGEHNETVLGLLMPKGKKSFAKMVDVLKEMEYEEQCEDLGKLASPNFDRPSSHSDKTAGASPIPKAVSVDEHLNGRPSTCRDSSDKGTQSELKGEAASTKSQEMALLEACESGNKDEVEKLIQSGVKVNCTEDTQIRRTPLHIAAEKNYDTVARVLLEHGADARATDKDGTTPLHVAVKCNSDSVTVARLLLDAKSDPSAQDKLGITPLYTAARMNYDEVARVLLEYEADTSAADTSGYTPLHISAFCNSDRAARLLLDAGSDQSAGTKLERTALHIAAQKNSDKVASILLESGSDIRATDEDGDTPLHETAYHNSDRVARLLLDAGSDVNAKSKLGITPLLIAAMKNYDKVAVVLLSAGSGTRGTDEVGNTALHIAAYCNSDRVAGLLLDNGSELSPTNQDGKTPLDMAEPGSLVAKLLQQSGGPRHTWLRPNAEVVGSNPVFVYGFILPRPSRVLHFCVEGLFYVLFAPDNVGWVL